VLKLDSKEEKMPLTELIVLKLCTKEKMSPIALIGDKTDFKQ
jgi:hypothetical protein